MYLLAVRLKECVPLRSSICSVSHDVTGGELVLYLPQPSHTLDGEAWYPAIVMCDLSTGPILQIAAISGSGRL